MKKEKLIQFPFPTEIKKIDSVIFTPHLNKNKPRSFAQTKTLICDLTNKKKYLNHL